MEKGKVAEWLLDGVIVTSIPIAVIDYAIAAAAVTEGYPVIASLASSLATTQIVGLVGSFVAYAMIEQGDNNDGGGNAGT